MEDELAITNPFAHRKKIKWQRFQKTEKRF